MHAMTPPPAIFDREARRLRRDRYARSGDRAFEDHLAALLLERIEDLKVVAGRALVINTGFGEVASALRAHGLAVDETDHGARFAAAGDVTLCDEDRLAVEPGAFDMVVMCGGLDSIDDVPGALILARRALVPGGRFLAAFPGAPSFERVRAMLTECEAAAGAVRPHFHPMIDVRAAGDLLVRAGFAEPVADVESQSLAYRTLPRLFADLRAAGLGNVLAGRAPASSAWLRSAEAAFAACGDSDGRVVETASLIVISGRAPRPTP